MVDIEFSTRGKTCFGRWKRNPDRISIYINELAGHYPPEHRFEEFISELSATVFHELGHVYGFRNGCKTNACKNGKCWWCNLTRTIAIWLMWDSGWKYRTDNKYLIDKYPGLYKFWVDE